MKAASIQVRATSDSVWLHTAALFATLAGLVGASIAVAHGNVLLGHGTPEPPLDFHLRASQRAQDDAQRCSRELLVLAARQPVVTARALEIDGTAIMAASGVAGLHALTSRAIERSVATVQRAVTHLEETAEGAATAAVVTLDDVGQATARAHRAADRLCEAVQVASAATLTQTVPRERLVGRP